MRWLIIGDVGGWNRYHVGDEAMSERTYEIVRSADPEARIAIVSDDPVFSASQFGVESVPRLGFQDLSEDQARDALLTTLETAEEGSVPAFAWLSGPGDGLIIAGGGNLNSVWPEYILERLALARRARSRNLPIIVTGQTIGPQLTGSDRAKVTELLDAAWWVGVREAHSFALCQALGVPSERLSYQVDDAAFPVPLIAGSHPFDRPPSATSIAVTLHPLTDPYADEETMGHLASAFQQVVDRTGCTMLFIPHAAADASVGAGWSDVEMGQELAQRMRPGAMAVAPLADAAETARLTRDAAFVITSRYHSLVFGLAAAVPCFALWSDEYTRIKLQGALAHYDRAEDGCHWRSLEEQSLVDRVAPLWAQRSDLAAALSAANRRLTAIEVDRRQALAVVLTQGKPVPAPAHPLIEEHLSGALVRTAAARIVDQAIDSRRQDRERTHFQQTADEAVRYAKSLEHRLADMTPPTRLDPILQAGTVFAHAVLGHEEICDIRDRLVALPADSYFAEPFAVATIAALLARPPIASGLALLGASPAMPLAAGLAGPAADQADPGFPAASPDRQATFEIVLCAGPARCRIGRRGADGSWLAETQSIDLDSGDVVMTAHPVALMAIEGETSGVAHLVLKDARTVAQVSTVELALVSGSHSDTAKAAIRSLHAELGTAANTAREAVRYAHSLKQALAETERYALSLESHLAQQNIDAGEG